MTDLDRAIADLRAVYTTACLQDWDVDRDAVGKALAALDAARGQAVWQVSLSKSPECWSDYSSEATANAVAKASGNGCREVRLVYLAPPAAAVSADSYTVDAVAWEEFIADWQQYVSGDPKMPFFRVREGLVAVIDSAKQAPPAAAVSEEAIEAAYWEFDARWRGYGPHKTTPQSERDAFKWAVRSLLAAAAAAQGVGRE